MAGARGAAARLEVHQQQAGDRGAAARFEVHQQQKSCWKRPSPRHRLLGEVGPLAALKELALALVLGVLLALGAVVLARADLEGDREQASERLEMKRP